MRRAHNRAIIIPADVPDHAAERYADNYQMVTGPHGRLFLFAADQKIEHLNDDFYGPGIDSHANDPEHIFEIAAAGFCNALAVPLGFLARHGRLHPTIPYIAKMNGKTNLDDRAAQDPFSDWLWTIDDVMRMRESSGLSICGIGYTLYLGGSSEHAMLTRAAQYVAQAHAHGLLALVWIYVRARHITNTRTAACIAGAAGLANALGADFVKVHAPEGNQAMTDLQALQIACQAAGNTGVICAGGARVGPQQLFETLHDQVAQGGVAGCAIGRNIFQREKRQAIALTAAIAAIVHDGASSQQAYQIFSQQ